MYDKDTDQPENLLHTTSLLQNRRIFFLLTALDMGGAERQALMLAQHLHVEQQAHVEVWGLGLPGMVSQHCTVHGIPWRSFEWKPGVLNRLAVIARVAVQLRRAKPEILLPYSLVPNVLASWLWRRVGAKSSIWNQRDEGRGLSRSLAKQIAVQLSPRFVANSRLGAETLAQRYNLPRARIEIIPNGVALAPPQQSPTQWRAALHLPPTSFVVGMAANLTPYKDHATLLRAWRIVLDSMTPEQHAGIPVAAADAKAEDTQAILLLAGQYGATHAALVELAQELGIEAHIRFLGPVDDIAGWLQVLDLGVHSSKLEGTPNAILEYMAAGLPVVATDIPPIRDIFTHPSIPQTSAEYLVPPASPEALAHAILALLRDPQQRQTLGAQNRRIVQAEYSPHQMIARMVKIIAQELERPADHKARGAHTP